MRLILFFIFFFLHTSDLSAQQMIEKRFAGRVSENRMREHVHRLVSFGNRFGGTVSNDRSAAYVNDQFTLFGVQSSIITEPDRITFSHDSWVLRVIQPKSKRKLIKNAWLAGYSPNISLQKAKLSFLDINQKIEIARHKSTLVLTPQSIDAKLYEELSKAGVRGILNYTRTKDDLYRVSAFINNLYPSYINPIPMFNVSTSDADSLRNILARNGEVVLEYSASTKVDDGAPKSVVAEIKGKQDSYFIVCAHGDADSGGPGADDNASGVAGVLEIARVLNGLIKGNYLPQPEYSIRFIIWGSEYYSADQYVRNNENDLQKIKGVINFDQIGTGATRECIYFESNDIPHNEELLRTFERIGEDFVGTEGFWKEATTNPSQGGTDSYIFLPDYLSQNKFPAIKIPSTTIFTAAWNEVRSYAQTPGWTSKAWKGDPDSVMIDYSPYYHSSLDLPRYTTELEPHNMAWVVKATGIALLRLAWNK